MSKQALRAQLAALLGQRTQVACVGRLSKLDERWSPFTGAADVLAAQQRFEAVILEARASLQQDVMTLKSQLTPGGSLCIVLDLKLGPVARLLSLVERTKPSTRSLEEVCGAPLMAGYCELTVHPVNAQVVVVAAHTPAAPNLLDAFFQQPLR